MSYEVAVQRLPFASSAVPACQVNATEPVPPVAATACGAGANRQASPVSFEPVSAWAGFATVGQLSQASPTPSLSPSAWVAFGFERQLSPAAVLGKRNATL